MAEAGYSRASIWPKSVRLRVRFSDSALLRIPPIAAELVNRSQAERQAPAAAASVPRMNVRRLMGVIQLFGGSGFCVRRAGYDEPTGDNRADLMDRAGGDDHENVHHEKEDNDRRSEKMERPRALPSTEDKQKGWKRSVNCR